jgi:hypothetical protein
MTITAMPLLRSAIESGEVLTFHKAPPATASTPRFGRFYDLWTYTGSPTAGTIPATTAGTVLSKSSVGAISFSSVVSGTKRLAQTMVGATTSGVAPTQSGALYVIDRLWHNGSVPMSFGTHTWIPSGPITRYTDGEGLRIMMTMWQGPSSRSNNPTHTITYTNQAGVSGKTAGLFIPWTLHTPGVGTECMFWPLAAGDTGVREIVSITNGSTAISGQNVGLAIVKVLAIIPVYEDFGVGKDSNFLATLLPAIDNNACISLIYALIDSYTTAASSCPTVSGSLTLIEG